MAIKPILFNMEMVRAILDGRKSCTRRAVKPQPKAKLCYQYAGSHKSSIGKWGYPSKTAYKYWDESYKLPDNISEEDLEKLWNPPCHTDDILYVRETWCRYGKLDNLDQVIEGTEKYYYRADGENPTPYNHFLVQKKGYDEYRDFPVWEPSIYMPKEAARIWLKVTNVRVERLQSITVDGAIREGAEGEKCHHTNAGAFGCTDCMNTGWIEPPQVEFMQIWDSTINKSDLDRYGWDANPWVWVIEFERCEKPQEVNDND